MTPSLNFSTNTFLYLTRTDKNKTKVALNLSQIVFMEPLKKGGTAIFLNYGLSLGCCIEVTAQYDAIYNFLGDFKVPIKQEPKN